MSVTRQGKDLTFVTSLTVRQHMWFIKGHVHAARNMWVKTTRQLRRRVGEHLGDVCHQRDTAVACHVWTCQKGDPKCLKFIAIDKVVPNIRKGDINKSLLQKETF